MSTAAAALWIKICGLRTPEAVMAAVSAGVDAVGFVFCEGSPRDVSAAAARVAAAAVPAGTAKVAVFLHPAQAAVDAAIEAIRPDWVQTDADDLPRLKLPPGQRVLPVYRTGGHGPTAVLPPRLLLESARSGAGERADWSEAADWSMRTQLVLAGGLDAGNVGAALAAVRPYGIDVSSGVESSRGVKDASLIRNFVDTARVAHARIAATVNVK
jgi:phosphoribosylanthranilate isomerase